MLIKVRRVSDGVGDGEGVIMSISVVVATVERFVQHRTGRHVKDFDSWTFENPACQSLLTAPAFQDVTKLATIGRGQTDFGKLEKIVQILFRNRVTGSTAADDWGDASRLWPAGRLDELGFGFLARRQRRRIAAESFYDLVRSFHAVSTSQAAPNNLDMAVCGQQALRPCGGNERENVNGRHAVGRWLAK